ncbi:MAG: S41 family peptidase [Candidatus Limnocylindrales bacterium]
MTADPIPEPAPAPDTTPDLQRYWQPPEPPRRPIGLVLLLVVVLAFGAGIAADRAGLFGAAGPEPTSAALGSQAPGATIGPGASVPADAPADIGLLWEALTIIRQHYVDRTALEPTSKLTYGMLDGLVRALGDPGHSGFLTPDQVKAANEDLSGSFSGIGAFLGEQAGSPIIVSVISGSPAAKAGLRSGDRIIAIDGAAADGLSVEDVVSRVRGPEGTTVTLTVIHPDAAAPVVIPVVRAQIDVPPVEWAMVPGTHAAMIRIVQFSAGTAKALQAAISESDTAGATAIVLDLRNDPGGLVDEAVGSASSFLSSGVVYVRQDADGKQTPVEVRSEPRTDKPLVVLVDFGTASSAEILTGALQDNGRAKVVGTRTYGTGTVLNQFALSDGSALRLGVELWLTPDGKRIFPEGITPDEVVDLGVGVLPLEPTDLKSMTPAALKASGDTQLLRALALLGVTVGP